MTHNTAGSPTSALPVSPVTGTAGVSVVDRIPVADTVAAYRAIRVDVGADLAGHDWISVLRCEATGYRFYFPHELAAESDFYTRLQRQRQYYADWCWEHGQALAELPRQGRILEIGTGSGNFLERVCQESDGREAIGLELNEEALRIARGRGLTVYQQRIEEVAQAHPGEFDAVCTFQVLEHVPQVRSFLDSACAVLKPGGRLLIGVPNSNPYLFKYDRLHALNLPPHHMGLWDRESLANLARVFPLSLCDIRVEPLIEPDYYWTVYLRHLKEGGVPGSLLAPILARLPWRISKHIHRYHERAVPGRNLLGIFERR